jgi:hypothetical protein
MRALDATGTAAPRDRGATSHPGIPRAPNL